MFDQVSLRDTVGIVCHPASELAGYCQWSLRDRIALAVGGQSRENGGGRPVFLTFSIGPWCPTLAAKNAVRMGTRLVAVASGYIPARRASSINPMEALRNN